MCTFFQIGMSSLAGHVISTLGVPATLLPAAAPGVAYFLSGVFEAEPLLEEQKPGPSGSLYSILRVEVGLLGAATLVLKRESNQPQTAAAGVANVKFLVDWQNLNPQPTRGDRIII